MDAGYVTNEAFLAGVTRYWIITYTGELKHFNSLKTLSAYLGLTETIVGKVHKVAKKAGKETFVVNTGLGDVTVYLNEPKDYAPAPTWNPERPSVYRDKSKALLDRPLVVGFNLWNVSDRRTEDEDCKRQCKQL